jgi:hypothetical protein
VKGGTKMNVFDKHQKNIAYKTLKMTPAMADIMGGMSFENAYKIIFRTDLKKRLNDLTDEYGSGDLYSWELQKYGWNNPKELLDLL